MESPHALLERARLPLATVALAGAVALTGAGCSVGESPAPKGDTPAVHYDAPAGADQLPKISSYERVLEKPSSATYVDTGLFAARAGAKDFDTLLNINPDKNGMKEDLPSGQSAPVLDIVMGTDGTLRFKSYQGDSGEQNSLLSVVASRQSVVEAAFKSGQVRQAHFRVFKPNQYPGHPEWQPKSEMQFVAHDYNDGGRPAVYYYMEGDMQDTEAMAMVFGHEFGHALLGQGEAAVPTPEQTKAFTEACTTMQQEALKHVSQDGEAIISSLAYQSSMVSKKFAPAYKAVIKSLRDGTYTQLPSHDPNAKNGVPACYLQDPWQAVSQYIKAHNINGGLLPEEMHTDEYEQEADEMVKDWSDFIKEGAIYRALSESTYVSKRGENGALGHPYDNVQELSASTTNLILTVPTELGEHVAALSANQRGAVVSVAGQNYIILKARHKDDPKFMKQLDDQYKQFADKAGVSFGEVTGQ